MRAMRVNSNRKDLAIATLKTHIAKTAPHPMTEALLAEIESGGKTRS